MAYVRNYLSILRKTFGVFMLIMYHRFTTRSNTKQSTRTDSNSTYIVCSLMCGFILAGVFWFYYQHSKPSPPEKVAAAKANHFNSQLSSITPTAVAIYRGLAFFTLFVVQVVQYATTDGLDGLFVPLSYFTVWNFHLCILVLGLSLYGSVRNLRNKQQQPRIENDVVLRAAQLLL